MSELHHSFVSRVWWWRAGWLAAALVLPWLVGNYWMSLAISAALMALAAMPLTVLTGTAGLLSLGQAAFLGIGGYCAGILAHQFNLGLSWAIPLAIVIGLTVGALIALATLRVVGLYLAVGTFALQVLLVPILQNIDVAVTQSTGFVLRDPSLLGVALSSPLRWWYVLLVLIVGVYAWLSWMQRTRPGRDWVMLRDAPTAARVLGISRLQARMGVFAMTSGIAAGVGALSAYYYGTAQSGAYSLHIAVFYLTVVALGGAGSLTGALWGAAVMTLLAPSLEWLLSHASGWIDPTRLGGLETLLVGVILMVSLIVRARLAEKGGQKHG